MRGSEFKSTRFRAQKFFGFGKSNRAQDLDDFDVRCLLQALVNQRKQMRGLNASLFLRNFLPTDPNLPNPSRAALRRGAANTTSGSQPRRSTFGRWAA